MTANKPETGCIVFLSPFQFVCVCVVTILFFDYNPTYVLLVDEEPLAVKLRMLCSKGVYSIVPTTQHIKSVGSREDNISDH